MYAFMPCPSDNSTSQRVSVNHGHRSLLAGDGHLEELTWPSLRTSSPAVSASGAVRSVVLTVACDVSWLGSSAADQTEELWESLLG